MPTAEEGRRSGDVWGKLQQARLRARGCNERTTSEADNPAEVRGRRIETSRGQLVTHQDASTIDFTPGRAFKNSLRYLTSGAAAWGMLPTPLTAPIARFPVS